MLSIPKQKYKLIRKVINMNHTKNHNPILTEFFEERNLSTSSENAYKVSVKHFEKVNNTTLQEALNTAEIEEENKIIWKKTTIRKQLIKYRAYVYEHYKKNTAKLYLTIIKTIFKHHEIAIHDLPYFSLKQVQETTPIYYDDLPDREIIKKSVEISNPKMLSMILFMSSSGCTKVDTLKLSISDLLIATESYHQSDIHLESLQILNELEEDIIPTWKLRRQKTNKNFFTFSSPESTEAILLYLKTENNISLNSRIWNIGSRYTNDYFKTLNEKLGLSPIGQYVKLRPHMLRKYHASQLYRAGMAQDKIDFLQGRSPSIVHQSYFKEDPDSLKQEYIQCLPFLVIDDSKRFKTELDIEKEKNITLKEEVVDLEKRLNRVEEIFDGVDIQKLDNLKRFL